MKVFLYAVVLCLTVCVEGSSLMNFRQMPMRRQQHTEQFVSFSAGLTQMVNLTTNSSVVFDKIFINTGNGYDATTGVFTCPHGGVYVFIYHGLSESAGQMWLDLYKNGQYEITGYAHNSQDYAAASNSILLQLADGDTVYVRGHGDNQLYGQADEIYATFSGYLLIPADGNSGHTGGR